MALVEGGAWDCPRHNFKTTDRLEWNEHCSDGDHFEAGYAVCTRCGEQFKYEGLEFHPYDEAGYKNISLKCDDCFDRTERNVKTAKIGIGTTEAAKARGASSRK